MPPGPTLPPSPDFARLEADRWDFFELAAVGAVQIELPGNHFVRANHRFVEMVGYSETELREMTFLDLTLPENVAWNRQVFQNAVQRGDTEFTIEKPLCRKDGSILWASVSAAIVRSESGDPLRTVAIVHDITARKQTELALAERERHLMLVLEAAPISIVYVDREERFRFANRVYLQRIARPLDQVVGQHVRTVIGDANYAAVAPQLKRAFAGEELRFDVRLHYAHLGWRDLHVRCNPERGPDGTVRGIVAASEDITDRKQAEAALRSSEQRLAAIFAAAAAGLSEISLEGRFVRVNDEICQITGRTRAELIGLHVLDVTFPEDQPATAKGVGELLEKGGCVSLDKRYLHPDGRVVWANSRITRIDDATGRPQALLAVTVDLSSRRAAELALAESEAKFRALAEAAPAIIWFIDEQGETRYVNRRYLEFFAKSQADVIGQQWNPPVHPEDREHYTINLLAAIRERRLLTCRARVERHDGAWRWIESQAMPHFDSSGRYIGHVGQSLDITEVVETTQALRHSEDRLRRATEIETVGIAFFNSAGHVTQTNAAFLQMTGYSAGEILGGFVRLDQLTSDADQGKVLHALSEIMALGRTHPYETDSVRKDGTHWWCLHAATRLSPEEGVEFVIDISTRRRNEEELHGYKEELEHRVLHRTAELDALNGALRDEILERTRAEQVRHELMRRLVSAQEDERRRISRELHDQVGQNLTALILGLKSLERPDAPPGTSQEIQRLLGLTQQVGKQIHDMALEIRPTALDDLGLLRTLSNYLDEWSKRTGVEVDFHSGNWTNERLPSLVETTLYRIVREALNNVVKHANARRVSLIVERQANQAVAIVEDDGKGFDPDTVLARSDRLGIVGMRERAMLAGGELSIESTPGSGTTVFARLPIDSFL